MEDYVYAVVCSTSEISSFRRDSSQAVNAIRSPTIAVFYRPDRAGAARYYIIHPTESPANFLTDLVTRSAADSEGERDSSAISHSVIVCRVYPIKYVSRIKIPTRHRFGIRLPRPVAGS